MNNTTATVLVAGILGITAVTIAKIVVDKKNDQKLGEQRDAFQAAHKIDDMVDEASVDNEKLESAEDKALAKDLMIKSKARLDSSKTLNNFKVNSDKFLKLYSDLTDGSADKVRANLLYFKRIQDQEEAKADRKALEAYQQKMMDRHYQNELDKFREGRKLIEAILPDSYTIGRIVRRAIPQNVRTEKVIETTPKEEVIEESA